MRIGYCVLEMREQKHVSGAAWSSEYKMALFVFSKKTNRGRKLHSG